MAEVGGVGSVVTTQAAGHTEGVVGQGGVQDAAAERASADPATKSKVERYATAAFRAGLAVANYWEIVGNGLGMVGSHLVGAKEQEASFSEGMRAANERLEKNFAGAGEAWSAARAKPTP